MVISHGDNDHAGGADWLEQQIAVGQRIGHGGTACNLGPTRWRGLVLRWAQAPYDGNDGSCVLHLSDGDTRVLLPGDIEAAGEQYLLGTSLAGPVDLVLAPHHGSKTSSSERFVEAFRPQRVVFPAGRDNRWRFPHPDVVARYRQVGSEILISGQTGQLQIDLGTQPKVLSYRQHLAPWWYNRQ